MGKRSKTVQSTKYPADAVGRQMDSNFPFVTGDFTVKQTLEYIKRDINRFDTIGYIFVVDPEKKLQGVVTIKNLFQKKPNVRLSELMERRLVKVLPWTSEENVVLLALQYDIKYVPVVDSEGHLVGIYTTRALRHFINQQVERRLLRASGVRWQKLFSGQSPTVRHAIAARLPWIIFGLLGSLLAGLIITAFQGTLATTIVLAAYIPLIMSTNANVANQSAMIFIRSLLMGNVRSATAYFFREGLVGLTMAAILAAVTFLATLLLHGSLVVATAVATAILFSLVFSSLLGAMIPYVLSLFQVEPALGAGPFLTTIKDIVSIFIYFGVASLILYFVR